MSGLELESEVPIKTFPLVIDKERQITLPLEVSNVLSSGANSALTLIQIGELVFLTRKIPKVSSLSERFMALMSSHSVELNSLLEGLQEERQTIWEESQSND